MAVAAPARPSTLAPPEPEHAPERERTSWAWGLAGCLLLALAMRVPYFGTSLGRDEGGVAFIAQNWPSGHGSLYGSYWLDRPPLSADPPNRQAVAVGRYVRTHARPGDTQYVMYAQADTGYYTGLASPYPYAWSLMVRAKPGAIAQLQSLLGSARRPTWLVEAQPARRWGLDPNGRTQRLIASHYRPAATVWGQRIYERNDR